MSQGTIDQLNFEVILDDKNFDERIKKDIDLAKKLNVSLSQLFDVKKKVAALEARSSKAGEGTLRVNRELSGEYRRQSVLLRDLASIGGAYFSVRGARDFLKAIVDITGEFETQKIALASMFGSAGDAERVLSEIRKMAVKSPYTFQDLSKYAKQLAAFGSAPDSIVNELNMMADLAAGVGADMSRLILAWGQIRSATVLRGQELRQLTETGLPVMEELAKVLTVTEGRLVSVGEVFDLVSKRAVTFDMVRQAFENMTSEGGKFYNMQETLASSIEGKVSNLRDAFQDMLRTIGENNSGLIKGAIDSTRALMENYQTIGKILAGLIVTYGSYKAALLTVRAIEKAKAVQTLVTEYLAMGKALGFATANQIMFNNAAKANVYIALASAVLGVAAAFAAFNKRREESLATSGEAARSYTEEIAELKKLMDIAGDEARSKEDRKKALDKINGTYSEYLEGMRVEATSAEALAGAYDKVSDALKRKYLEEQKAAMTADQQTAMNNAQAALWGYIRKIVPKSGVSAQGFGGIMSRLQNAFGRPGAQWGATEIYNEIIAAITGAGGSLSSKNRGSLYRRVWDYTEARRDLGNAESLFKQFEDGFTSAIDATNKKMDTAEAQILTKASTVAEGIKVIDGQIRALERKAKETGLSDSEIKTLADLRDDLEGQKKRYETLTGGKYGTGSAGKKYHDETEDFYKKIARDVSRYADDVTKAEIDAMDDGNEKVLLSLDLQHQQRIRALKEQYEDEMAQLEKTASEHGEKFDPSTDPRAKALLGKYSQAFLAEDLKHESEMAATEKKMLEERENNRLEYLRRFGTLKEKEQSIREKYEKKITRAEADGDTYGAKLAKGEMEAELDALNREYSTLFGLIFADAGSLTDSLLAKAVRETQKEIKKAVKDGGDIKDLSELYERLRALTEEKVKRNTWGVGGIVEALGMLRASAANMNSSDRATSENALGQRAAAFALLVKSGEELTEIAKSAAEALSAFPGMLGEIGAALSGLVGDAESLVKAFTSTDKGDLATAGIGAALNILEMIGGQISENKKALEEWEKALRNAEQAARMRKISEAGESRDNIFDIGNPYKKAIAGMAKYTAAMSNLAKMQDALAAGSVQIGQKAGISLKNIGKGLGSGAAAGAALGSIIPGLGTLIGGAIGAAVGGVTGALATEAKPVFESLLSHYGELFDEEFNLNPKIIDDYQLLDDMTKEIVDNWSAVKDAATDAMEEMHDNLSSLVGDMADEIRDKLVEAWRSREIFDAVDDIGDYVSGMIEDILEQSVFASVFQNLFEDLQAKMENSFAPGGDQDITDELTDFLEVYPSLLERYSDAMDAARQAASEKGLDLWKGTAAADSMSAGIQSITETTASLLSSYVNAMRADLSAMRSLQAPFFSGTVPKLNDYMAEMSARTARINDDTNRIVSELSEMLSKIKSVITPSPSGGSAVRTTK